MKVAKGISSAAINFVAVGVIIPFALNYFSPQISKYIALPPPSQIWVVFILFGIVFAITGFLQSGYSKGDFPWLFGKIGGGLAGIALFYYLFLLLPSSVGSTGVESSGLIGLVVLAILLSYGYLVFDFLDARRKNKARKAEMDAKAAQKATALGGS